MTRMYLPITVGFIGILALVQGCSSAGSTPSDELTSGDEDPGSPTDRGAVDNTEKPAPAPAPTNGGTPPATPPAAPPVTKSKMTFFVTSTGTAALGGNLGGLIGADKKCQDLATAVN